MNAPGRSSRAGRTLTILLIVQLGVGAVRAEEMAALIRDRAAVERIYYNHRLGEKPSFEQVLSPATLEKLVRQDLSKETALKKSYGVEVTPAMLEAEVLRINTTTRAPDVLAEIKAALGNDSARFARAVARPIVVERLLREKFDNDDALNAPQRLQAEQTRGGLLAAKKNGAGPEQLLALLKQGHANDVTETTWRLGARPAEINASAADEIEIKKRFGSNAQLLSAPPGGGNEQKFYFEDLPVELQNVVRAQLRHAGDVSAVIETPGGFLLYVAKEKTDAVLSVAGLFLRKRSYEQWLEEQAKEIP